MAMLLDLNGCLKPDVISARFKARLVIKCYEQVKGIDFTDTYAPVGRLSTLRTLLSLASHKKWKFDLMNVKTAFLNPEIDKNGIYMGLHEGIEWLNSSATSNLVEPQKALCGLKQAPHLWYKNIDNFLKSLGLRNQ
jgi:hypothetical protein